MLNPFTYLEYALGVHPYRTKTICVEAVASRRSDGVGLPKSGKMVTTSAIDSLYTEAKQVQALPEKRPCSCAVEKAHPSVPACEGTTPAHRRRRMEPRMYYTITIPYTVPEKYRNGHTNNSAGCAILQVHSECSTTFLCRVNLFYGESLETLRRIQEDTTAQPNQSSKQPGPMPQKTLQP